MQRYQLPLGIVVALAPFERCSLDDKTTVVVVPLYLVEWLEEILNARFQSSPNGMDPLGKDPAERASHRQRFTQKLPTHSFH